jgi:YD repeat-containing protein
MPLGAKTTYVYDTATGNETQQIDANGHVTSFTYDASGNPLTRTLPDVTGQSTAVEHTFYGTFNGTENSKGIRKFKGDKDIYLKYVLIPFEFSRGMPLRNCYAYTESERRKVPVRLPLARVPLLGNADVLLGIFCISV